MLRPNINVCRNALALVFVVCEFLDDGFELVDRAAHQIAEKIKSEPYKEVVLLLGSGDLDVQTNTLTLLNVLLKKSGDKRTRKRLILQLEQVGVFDILEVK